MRRSQTAATEDSDLSAAGLSVFGAPGGGTVPGVGPGGGSPAPRQRRRGALIAGKFNAFLQPRLIMAGVSTTSEPFML